jgi:hypothetical protein
MSKELSDFFKLIAEQKRQKKELIEQDKKILREFENFIYSEGKPKKKKTKALKTLGSETADDFGNLPNISPIPMQEETLVERSLGLLSEPSDVRQRKDPITPLNQNFATHEDLQKHYKLFLERVQQQLSTLGGGGETRLEFLDDVDRNSVKTDNYYLKYDASIKKWIGDSADGVGITSIVSISGITTYYQSTDIDDYIGISANVPVTITLPLNPSLGKKLIIKDEGNKVNTYNVTVQAGIGKSVENDTNVIMSINHQSLTFFYNGTNWYII